MEKFILRQKWLGFCAVILVSLIASIFAADSLNRNYQSVEPYIYKEMGYFLPITFKNGEIVSPRNTVIERSYGPQNNAYKVVLDTRVDDLNIADLQSGIYLTRNKFYTNKGEVKIQSIKQMPDMELTAPKVKEFLTQMGRYLKPAAGLFIFAMLVFYIGLSALFYTVIMHWIFKKSYGADFSLTLRVNTLAYLILLCIGLLTSTNFGFIVTLLVMMACNYLANILLEKK